MGERNRGLGAGSVSPEEQIYPLNFVCDYVIDCKERLALEETDTVRSIMEIKARSESLLATLEDRLAEIGSSLAIGESENLEHLVSEQRAIVEDADDLLVRLSRKGFIFEDMTNLLDQTQPLISGLIFRDTLTVAYNRFFFLSKVEGMMWNADPLRGFSMVFIDVDDFKRFNTEFGHEFGDEVLREFCRRAQAFIKHLDSTYLVRMGGDEFVIVSYENYETLLVVINGLRMNISGEVFEYAGKTAHASISIGAANTVQDRIADTDALYELADNRLYVAKGKGKNAFVHRDEA